MTAAQVGKARRRAEYAMALFLSFVFWDRIVAINVPRASPRRRFGLP
jgi:hypothetical protein